MNVAPNNPDEAAAWEVAAVSSMPDAEDRYAQQQQRGFSGLRFEADLEQDFLHSHQQLSGQRIRVANLCVLVAAVAFLMGTRDSGGAQAEWLLAIALLPLLMVGAGLTLIRLHPVRRQRLDFLQVAGFAVGLAALIGLGRQAGLPVPYEPMLLLVVYIYFLSGLLFRQAISCGLLAWATYTLLIQGQVPTARALYEGYYLLVMHLLGCLGLYFVERRHRQAYLLENQLRLQAVTDGLTKLMNRGAFRSHLDAVWQMAVRDGKRIGLVLMDLDHFKAVNDECGHLAGDEALIQVGTALRTQIKRPLDAAARFGGDEFVAVWFDVEPDWFAGIPERIRSALDGLVVHGDGRHAGRCPISTSIGAVTLQPGAGSTPKQAMSAADELLYAVKEAGRNGFRVRDLDRTLDSD